MRILARHAAYGYTTEHGEGAFPLLGLFFCCAQVSIGNIPIAQPGKIRESSKANVGDRVAMKSSRQMGLHMGWLCGPALQNWLRVRISTCFMSCLRTTPLGSIKSLDAAKCYPLSEWVTSTKTFGGFQLKRWLHQLHDIRRAVNNCGTDGPWRSVLCVRRLGWK